jgi:hypothetical protein
LIEVSREGGYGLRIKYQVSSSYHKLIIKGETMSAVLERRYPADRRIKSPKIVRFYNGAAERKIAEMANDLCTTTDELVDKIRDPEGITYCGARYTLTDRYVGRRMV